MEQHLFNNKSDLHDLVISHSCLEHLNYLGIDERFGPVALSLKREKLDESTSLMKSGESEGNQYQYRIIARTSEVINANCWGSLTNHWG